MTPSMMRPCKAWPLYHHESLRLKDTLLFIERYTFCFCLLYLASTHKTGMALSVHCCTRELVRAWIT